MTLATEVAKKDRISNCPGFFIIQMTIISLHIYMISMYLGGTPIVSCMHNSLDTIQREFYILQIVLISWTLVNLNMQLHNYNVAKQICAHRSIPKPTKMSRNQLQRQNIKLQNSLPKACVHTQFERYHSIQSVNPTVSLL